MFKQIKIITFVLLLFLLIYTISNSALAADTTKWIDLGIRTTSGLGTGKVYSSYMDFTGITALKGKWGIVSNSGGTDAVAEIYLQDTSGNNVYTVYYKKGSSSDYAERTFDCSSITGLYRICANAYGGFVNTGYRVEGYIDNISVCVYDTPSIVVEPSSKSIHQFGTDTFTAVFNNSPSTYQWQWSQDNGTWTDIGGSDISVTYSGVDSTTLSVTPKSISMDGYYYRLKAINLSGTGYSNAAKLTVLSASPTIPESTNLTRVN